MTTVDPLALCWREMSDLGNAERLEVRAGGKLVHVREWGWVAYNGIRWSAEDGQRLAMLKTHEVARGIRDEIAALAEVPDEELRSRFGEWCTTERRQDRVINLHKHAVQSGNASKATAMLAQAATLDELNRRMDDFDGDLLVVNTSNRTLRFRRTKDAPEGKRWHIIDAPHDPADLLTRAMTCDYDPKAEAPGWHKHLTTVLPDPAVRDYFQQVIGYALSGLTVEQCMFMLQGKGGDGKSTTMNILRELMGGYGVAADVQTFMAAGQRSGADATPDLVRLAGDTRLVCTQEPKRGSAIDEQRIKQFTGGSPIQARANYGDAFEFKARGKLFMECNSRPRISGDDDGIWRRIVIILFPHQFKGAAIDKGVEDRLLAEGPGILNWMLEGLRLWLEAGRLVQPPSVAEAVEEYRRSANPFGEWMAARVDTSDPNVLTLSSSLYNDYKSWCEAEGVSDRELMNSTAFGRALGDRQILLGPKDGKGLKRRRGARLRDNDAPLSAAADSAPSMPASPDSGAYDDPFDIP
ncbi:DNA primase family protein [Sphingomonas aquatilis]|uniref:DNA primase/helicase n=1 Tax=Sphingomonas aquatilis TaxID=93063 RepID=A0AAW3TQT9_9SPHN|nr:DNA primase family protein [Sphingomonas aquatilis]MBB3875298.1 putative DNA primase/helicase [Sphingomonas aquatilis]